MLKKRKKRILFFTCKARKLRSLYSRDCTYMQLANGKRKKKEKERKKTWPLFAEKTTGNVNKNKEDKLP